MNKKTQTTKLTRLTLNQETLRSLSDKELTAVAGGYFSVLSNCIFNQCTKNN